MSLGLKARRQRRGIETAALKRGSEAWTPWKAQKRHLNIQNERRRLQPLLPSLLFAASSQEFAYANISALVLFLHPPILHQLWTVGNVALLLQCRQPTSPVYAQSCNQVASSASVAMERQEGAATKVADAGVLEASSICISSPCSLQTPSSCLYS